MDQQHSSKMLSLAKSYVRAGLSVLPITLNTKKPAVNLLPRIYEQSSDKHKASWKPFQERLPHDDELERWFSTGAAGVGIIGGAVSGGLVILDLESAELYDRWRDFALMLLEPHVIESLPVVASGKGRHIYFRMPQPGGNRKLAMLGAATLAETRGEGGYVLAPPTLHPSGAVYTLLHGDLHSIPYLDATQAQSVLDAARALTPAIEHPSSKEPSSGHNDVIGSFNSVHTITDILEAHGYNQESPNRYIRPGGDRSSVVIVEGRSVHHNPADPLYSEAPGGGQHSHTPFSAWCQLIHNGDVRAAVREAAKELGLSRTSRPNEVSARASQAIGEDAEDPSWPYFLDQNCMWMRQKDRDGEPKAPLLLCNFTAHIASETLIDDGDNQEEWYTITATCQHRTRTIELRRTEFESEGSLSRIVATLGARARINPRTQPKYVLDAIKAFSQDVDERMIYTHTGWVGDRYLFVNGYVDADGWHEAPGCQLPRRLHAYSLHPQGEDMDDALALFDVLLDLAPSSVMVPLVGSVLLGPISAMIDAPAPMLHVNGPTGSHKTSISCAALALMGKFTPAQPTDTWTSTSNSIQRLGWYLKDAPMLLDDYKAAHVKPQQVTFLLQNYGDNMARGRLDANSDVRATFPMRCVLLSSGEDQPEGEASTLARILSVSLARRAVDRQKLTTIQQHAPQLHNLTVAYLSWLATRPDTDKYHTQYQAIRASILPQLEAAIDTATNPGRIASNVAVLSIAWETFVRFMTEREYWSLERGQSWLATCKHELLALAQEQLHLTAQERYSQTFLEAVRGLIASNKAILQRFEQPDQETPTSQVVIGASDAHGTYLIAQTSYDEVCKHLRAAGRNVNFSARALGQMLHQEGLLLSTEPPTLMIKKRINGIRPRCWHLPPNVLDL